MKIRINAIVSALLCLLVCAAAVPAAALEDAPALTVTARAGTLNVGDTEFVADVVCNLASGSLSSFGLACTVSEDEAELHGYPCGDKGTFYVSGGTDGSPLGLLWLVPETNDMSGSYDGASPSAPLGVEYGEDFVAFEVVVKLAAPAKEGDVYTINLGILGSNEPCDLMGEKVPFSISGTSVTAVAATCEHSWSEESVLPDCVRGGYTRHTCLLCGKTYTDNLQEGLGHVFTDGKCERCGAEEEARVLTTMLRAHPLYVGESELVVDVVGNLTSGSFSCIGLYTSWDSEVMSLYMADEGVLSGSYQTSESEECNPFLMLWSGIRQNFTNKKYNGASPDAPYGVEYGEDFVIYTLTFELASPAEEGSEYRIELTPDEGNLPADIDSVTIDDYESFGVTLTAKVVVELPEVCDHVFEDGVCTRCGEADPNYVPVTYGDVNGDGKVNLADVTATLKYIAGWDVTIDSTAADVNLDDKVNLTDVTLMLKFIAGWDVKLGK